MIPYQLLADDRINSIEEKLYGFIYWFSKLKNERCTAGNEALADLVKTSPRVIQNALTNLEKRGYILRTYRDRNKRVRDEIMPLIDFNTIPQPRDDDDAHAPAKRRKSAEVVVAEKKEETPGAGSETNDMIALFEPVNPSFERLFSNKTQRAAIDRMLKKMGKEKLSGTIKFACECQDQPYAPSITTPLQLETKLGQLIQFFKKENQKGPKLVTI